MFSLILDSMKLFITGRLFANYGQVFVHVIMAVTIGATVTIIAGHVTSLLWASVAGGVTGGFLLPILFKNLKYR